MESVTYVSVRQILNLKPQPPHLRHYFCIIVGQATELVRD